MIGLLVTTACLVYSGLRAPTPAVNEPHYLAKARHFFDPAWCRGDFFLESSNPHLVFYVLTGPLTQAFPLATVAWIGRVLGLLLLGTGWTALVRNLLADGWAALIATAGFLLAAATGNLSGEWVVGGVESKLLAYGLLAWSAANAINRRHRLAAALCGLAISVHPIVGGWGLVLAVLARPLPIDRQRLIQAGLVFLCALPGALPALSLLGDGTTQADSIQVFTRLGHHLVPIRFSLPAVITYIVGLAAWLCGRRFTVSTPQESWWTRVVLAAVFVAVVGYAVALDRPPGDAQADHLRLVLMKFYPYRLVDVLLPAALSITIAGVLTRHARLRSRLVTAAAMLLLALMLPARDRNPSRLNREMLADWKDTCRWIDTNLPEDAVVLTPRGSWAFKWYARRAEYVVFKDCPQNATGIVEWDRRLQLRGRWLLDIQLGKSPGQTTATAFPDGNITHILWRRGEHPASLDGLDELFATPHHIVYAAPSPESQ